MSAILSMRAGLADSFRNALPMLRSAGLVGSAEIVNRITHVVTAIALARSLDVIEFGIAAAAITTHELTRMLVQNGLGARIVTAHADDVDDIVRCAHRLNWLLGWALAASQIATAAAIHFLWGSPQLALAIALLAVVHVIYPMSMVQVFLAQRDGRWGCLSGAIGTQAVFDNMLTAGLALCGAGLWAVIVPKVLAAPLWVMWHRRATRWSPSRPVPAGLSRKLISYSLEVLGVEMLSTLRTHGDKALVGLLMGPLALGLYAFAANIANSITIGLSQCINAVMLPFLRKGRDEGELLTTFGRSLAAMLLPVVPVIAIQGALSPWYVPLVFGEKWTEAIPLLVVLSAFSVVRPVIVATSQLLRATDDTRMDAWLAALTTTLFFVGLALGSVLSLFSAALGACVGLSVGASVGLWIASRRAGRRVKTPRRSTSWSSC